MSSHSPTRGAQPLVTLVALVLAAPAFAQQYVPIVPLRDARLLGSDTVASDAFGYSVDVSGDTAVVGAPAAETQLGAAYVFVRSLAGWTEQAKLVASDGAFLDRFGAAVAIDGDRIAVSALTADVGGVVNIGAVYVFERNSPSSWVQTAKLVGIGADVGEGLGWSLDLQGDTLVAGAVDDHHSGGQFDGGAAYVFVHQPSGWVQEQRVIAAGGEAFDYFGHAVALDGDTLVVGAYSDNHPAGANGGSVYVFQRNFLAWTQVQKIVPTDNAANDFFGFALDLQQDALVVGAPGADFFGMQDSGAAYWYERTPGAGFGFRQKHQAFSVTPFEQFGTSVALSGDSLAIGAYQGDSPFASGSGTVSVFQRTILGYLRYYELRSTVSEPGAGFGASAALDGELMVVGAPSDDTPTSGLNSGSVYTYRLVPAVESYCVGKTNSLGCTPSIDWQGYASVSSFLPFWVTASDVLNQKSGLLFYGFDSNDVPFMGGTLCVANPLKRTYVQNSGGNPNVNDCSGTFTFDINGYMDLGSDPELIVGAEVFAQYWSRDPQSSASASLTDALRFHVRP